MLFKLCLCVCVCVCVCVCDGTAAVIFDTYLQRSKGYGFVTFATCAAAEAALENPFKEIDGRVTETILAARGKHMLQNGGLGGNSESGSGYTSHHGHGNSHHAERGGANHFGGGGYHHPSHGPQVGHHPHSEGQ